MYGPDSSRSEELWAKATGAANTLADKIVAQAIRALEFIVLFLAGWKFHSSKRSSGDCVDLITAPETRATTLAPQITIFGYIQTKISSYSLNFPNKKN